MDAGETWGGGIDIMDCSVENIYEVDGFRFQFAQFRQNRLRIRMEVSLWNAQNDKDKDRETLRQQGEERTLALGDEPKS